MRMAGIAYSATLIIFSKTNLQMIHEFSSHYLTLQCGLYNGFDELSRLELVL